MKFIIDNKDFLTIIIPIIALFLTFLIDLLHKRTEENKRLKSKLKLFYNLQEELIKETECLIKYFSNEVVPHLQRNSSKTLIINISSHTGGIITRLTKLSYEDIHKSFMKYEKRNPQSKFESLYREIDFFDDFYKNTLLTIKLYQKSSQEIKIRFRNELYELIKYNGNLIQNLKSTDLTNKDELYIRFYNQLYNDYNLNMDTRDLKYHFDEYVRPLFLEVIESFRQKFYASEIIARYNTIKLIKDEIEGNAELYIDRFIQFTSDLNESKKQLEKILKINGM